MQNSCIRLLLFLTLLTIAFSSKLVAAQKIERQPDGVIVYVKTGAVKIQDLMNR